MDPMDAIWDGLTRVMRLIANVFETCISSGNPMLQVAVGMFFISFFLAILLMFFDTKDD